MQCSIASVQSTRELCTLFSSYAFNRVIIDKKKKKKLQAFQMDFLRRSCGISILDYVRNDRMKVIMDLDKMIIDREEEKRLVWYGHLQKMSEERWLKKIWEWTPHGRRRTTMKDLVQ
jgi:cobalamin biosynthesis Co2+ chelatase CbiK